MTNPTEKPNVFVIGLDEFNRKLIEALPEADGFILREAVSWHSLKAYGEQSAESILAEARENLAGERVAALVTWWDFPGTLFLALLCGQYGFRGPSFDAVMRCEHKYWSRIEQAKAIPEAIPPFAKIDSRHPPSFEELEMDKPFWIKPVKSTESMLGFRVRNPEDYRRAIEGIQRGIGPLARAFNEIMQMGDLPEDLREVDGYHCLVEGSCSGSLHTVSGIVDGGEVRVYGIVDSLNYRDSSSFFCYRYPSDLPEAVQERMADLSTRVIGRIGLTHTPFNIEFFHNPANGDLRLLEINPRVSQSHGDLYAKVDGKSNELLAVEIALGRTPHMPKDEGAFAKAAKFFHRSFKDGFVKKIPTREEIAGICEDFPEIAIRIEAEEGKRLSELPQQDTESFVLAVFFLGADSNEELAARYQAVTRRLEFEIQS